MAYNGDNEGFGEFNYQVPVFPRGESEQDAFMTSAPGKVIVFGEHAVVYGKVRFVLPQQFENEAHPYSQPWPPQYPFARILWSPHSPRPNES